LLNFDHNEYPTKARTMASAMTTKSSNTFIGASFRKSAMASYTSVNAVKIGQR